jgi:hypothetical protein
MSNDTSLYIELKGDIESLALPLFDASETFIGKRGAFLPHGAILTNSTQVQVVNFAPEDFETRKVNAEEILPGLHEALRKEAKSEGVIAVGVAEDVTITLDSGERTRAIKVRFEHKKGLTVALYLPWKRKLFGGIQIGDPITIDVQPEILPWTNS